MGTQGSYFLRVIRTILGKKLIFYLKNRAFDLAPYSRNRCTKTNNSQSCPYSLNKKKLFINWLTC